MPDVPVSHETTHINVKANSETDDGETDCGDPDCDSSSNAPGEDEWKQYLRAFVRDKAADFYGIVRWAKDRSSRGTDSDRASATTGYSASTDTSGGTNRRDSTNSGALKRGHRDRDSYLPDDQGDRGPDRSRVALPVAIGGPARMINVNFSDPVQTEGIMHVHSAASSAFTMSSEWLTLASIRDGGYAN
jgi:hypothetical protein